MGKDRESQAELLGKLRSEVVGLQYHEASVEKGRVNLEREPDNAHDANAIRVENARFEPVGHLPKREAAYLAPLLDAGKIVLEGAVTDRPRQNTARLELDVYVAAKGAEIAHPPEKPQTAAAFAHRTMAEAFQSVVKGEVEPAAELLDVLRGLVHRDVWPETRLLYELIGARAAKLKDTTAVEEPDLVEAMLGRLVLGDPLVHENMAVFPLLGDDGAGVDYVLLDDALKSRDAVVTEMSEGGSVPQLRFVNKGKRRVLLLDGDQLIGAKQNRIINITILVGAKKTLVVPVSCVEQGRWHSVSRQFESGRRVSPSLRGLQCASVRASVLAGNGILADQSAVWSKVDAELNALGVESQSEALSEGYEAVGKTLEAYRQKLTCPADAKGVIVAIDGTVAGIELFDKAETLRRTWGKLIEAYATEAVMSARRSKEVKPTAEESADEFLASVRASVRDARPALGEGLYVYIEGDGLVGTALVAEGQVIHLAAFRKPELPTRSPLPPGFIV
ncbi:MAG: HIRAN domain-containing protein [Verrucomicrobia bacterium]|nr:HIRAN domain-containing protein [Verrucomicrobiota bacterium]